MERYVCLKSPHFNNHFHVHVPSFYNRSKRIVISSNAKDAILQRYISNNFVIILPSSHILEELDGEKVYCTDACICECCAIHASCEGTCKSPVISNPSEIDSDRTISLSSNDSTVPPSEMDSDITISVLTPSEETDNHPSESSSASSNCSSKSFSILRKKQKKNK